MEQAKYNELMLRGFRYPTSESRLLYFIESLTKFIEAYEKALHPIWQTNQRRGERLANWKPGEAALGPIAAEVKPWKSPILPREICDWISDEFWLAMLPTFERIVEINEEAEGLIGQSDIDANRELHRLQNEKLNAMDKALNFHRDYRVGCFAMLDHVRKHAKISGNPSRTVTGRHLLSPQAGSGDKIKTTVAEKKFERGEWMLDNCDPTKLKNRELQKMVNEEGVKRGWQLFESETGNGAFDAYKQAYLKRHGVPFSRDNRGRSK